MHVRNEKLILSGLLGTLVVFAVGLTVAQASTEDKPVILKLHWDDTEVPGGSETVRKQPLNNGIKLQVNVHGTLGDKGSIHFRAGTQDAVSSDELTVGVNGSVEVAFEADSIEGVLTPGNNLPIAVKWVPSSSGGTESPYSDSRVIFVDNKKPILKSASARGNGTFLDLRFDDADINRETIKDALKIQQRVGADTFHQVTETFKVLPGSGSVATLEFDSPLVPGQFKFELAEASSMSDIAGNPLEKIENSTFLVAYVLTQDPKISINATDRLRQRSGIPEAWVTNSKKIPVLITAPALTETVVTMAARVNGQTQPPVTTGSLLEVSLHNEGENFVQAVFFDKDGDLIAQSNQLKVLLDTIGPRLSRVDVINIPDRTGTRRILTATFDTDTLAIPDAAKTTIADIRKRDDPDAFGSSSVALAPPVLDGNRAIRIDIDNLVPGEYQLNVKATTVTDSIGNLATEQSMTFTVDAERNFGQHVEFPPFAPPQQQSIPDEGFNPGDFVETRVSRLYYYRDAHRVAQIINRNIRSFNQAAVTLAERRAEESRVDAELATDERRRKESEATQAAQQARSAEQQLAQAQQIVAESQQVAAEKTAATTRRDALQARLAATPEDQVAERSVLTGQIAQLNQTITETQATLDLMGDVSGIAASIPAMQQSVANLRQRELSVRDEWKQAEAKENRAKAEQFRKEVTAAETDPDTYVAGDIHSKDPVTQCSLSVIGEGLIQIRGPIKGINKIRTMINQIDSPVGQIKVGIFTVQVNGEKGERLEKVVGDAEGYIDLSRFLVNQSLNLLRRAIQMEAANIALVCEQEGHYQVDRDRRYLYAFFGRDFIDELYALNSEFLFTENKLLSLHAMDTISLNRALFILALAKNDVRERIVANFLASAKTDLADAEYDFRRSSELRPHKTLKWIPGWNRTRLAVQNKYHHETEIMEAVHRQALQRYHFRNFQAFFDAGIANPDTMNPMQREFIRLAQVFKARLVAEMELKQRVIERGLIEDRSNDERARAEVYRSVHAKALGDLETALTQQLDSLREIEETKNILQVAKQAIEQIPTNSQLRKLQSRALSASNQVPPNQEVVESVIREFTGMLTEVLNTDPQWITLEDYRKAESELQRFNNNRHLLQLGIISKELTRLQSKYLPKFEQAFIDLQTFYEYAKLESTTSEQLSSTYTQLLTSLRDVENTQIGRMLKTQIENAWRSASKGARVRDTVERIEGFLDETRGSLDHRKMLDYLIDEQEDKFIELVEGTRSYISVMDQYLKRLSIALEDDFKVQFYDPAFIRVREAARRRNVTLSQVERTTILTNNRDFAKVDPQATMEFDLPKRQIAIKEAFDAAKALVEDTGALMNDPTFLAAFQMMGGSKQPTTVKNVIPGQSLSTDQHIMGLVPPPPGQATPGSALQSLVPEPAIFKLETGTGFQIRPVMQPDGDSAVYDFDYMYTTNINEPVRADEKHLGRVKRHYVHTAVQTGNFELREISRYQVGLRVSRTSRGVPLLEDIPVVGAVFRPAPSDESSLQQNVIFGQTNLYPTLFDLMGLRWAQQIVDLDHLSLLESEHVIRGRQKAIRNFVFGEASRRVDEFLEIPTKDKENHRPDFYREQTQSSPHHPQGYHYRDAMPDKTGRNYELHDRRPPEMQDPPYDRYRHRPVVPESIGPLSTPEEIPAIPNPRPDYGDLQGTRPHSAYRMQFDDGETALQSVMVETPAQ